MVRPIKCGLPRHENIRVHDKQEHTPGHERRLGGADYSRLATDDDETRGPRENVGEHGIC